MIRVEHLWKRYGGITAVEDLSFEVAPGETFALVGPNGAGKTTTLKCLLGLVRPDRGTIAIGAGARPPHDPGARAALGYVPQRVEFAAGRTVAEVLGFFAALRGLPAGAVDAALARVGMRELASRRATELSGGFAQRLSLAQALLGDPELLVLDEPTASLDPQATWEFRSLVLELRAQGKTILLCSHLLAEVERVADRVLILVGGRRAGLVRLSELTERQVGGTRLLLELGEPAERARGVLASRGLGFTAVNGHALAVESRDGRFLEALEALRGAGVPLRRVELQRPTLEEAFLAAVRGEGDGGPTP